MNQQKNSQAVRGVLWSLAALFLVTTGASNAATTPASAALAQPSLIHGQRVDLDAAVTIETRQLSADGVTRTTRSQERLMRRGDQVWSERVLPQVLRERHAHAHGAPDKKSSQASSVAPAHKHFNPVEFGRLVTLEGEQLRLEYVSLQQKVVVAVPKPEYGNVGFDGSALRAYYLIVPQDLARLKASERPPPTPSSVWYERSGKFGYERVLWDRARAIVLQAESASADGSQWFRVRVNVSSLRSKAIPWQKMGGFEQRAYSDYLD